MSRWKTYGALTIAAALGFIAAAPATAQVWVAGPPILVPNVAPLYSPPNSYSVVSSYPVPTLRPSNNYFASPAAATCCSSI